MEKAKEFIVSNKKWKVLDSYIFHIENYIAINDGLVIENCKSFLESILKTIIVEVDKKTENELKKYNINQLNKEVLRILDIKEYSAIIKSFCNDISMLRNKLGETSHGKDIHTMEERRGSLKEDEIKLLVTLTDNISFFLLKHYKDLYPNLVEKRRQISYEDNNKFNEWFDENHPPLKVAEIDLTPSQVLFDNDKEAYKSHLLAYSEEESEKNNLIESLAFSPNFSTTHLIVGHLSQHENFSSQQIRSIWLAFMQNNQVHRIARDFDIESFFKPIILNNKSLFSDDGIARFLEYYDR